MIPRHHHALIRLLPGLLVLLTGLLTGCGSGLPQGIKDQARNVPNQIKETAAFVEQQQKKYHTLTGSSDFQSIKHVAEKENWENQFNRAKDTLNRADRLFEDNLNPLIKQNNPNTVPEIQKQLHRIKNILVDAQQVSRIPLSRSALLFETIAKTAQYRADARKHARQISQTTREFKTGTIDKALADFPDNAQKINDRFAPFLAAERRSKNHLDRIETEYQKHTAGDKNTDYAAFADSTKALADDLKKLQGLEASLSKEIDQLYKSYTKILKDMKAAYHVTIMRESWDENSDYYMPELTRFQRDVSADVFEAVTADHLDAIAEITAGYGGSRLSNKIGSHWKALAINPGEQWPNRTHNAASFWVEDARETYYHKYILEENGQTTETDWQKVDASFYEANMAFLGMAILSKPYGVFESGRLTQAAPPGMAYVGNSQYGQWQEDKNGDRFWSWYGRYAFFSNLFFFPPFYYSYNSWHGWHNNYRYKKPYFGKTKKGFQKFGTFGTYVKKSPKFQSTNFAQSGGFRAQTASVRGANLRGGGPKTKGK